MNNLLQAIPHHCVSFSRVLPAPCVRSALLLLHLKRSACFRLFAIRSDSWRETSSGARRRVSVYAQFDGSRLAAVGFMKASSNKFHAFEDVNLNRLSRRDEMAEPFFYESLYGRSVSVPVGVTLMKSGVGFSVKRTPEALLLLSDLLLAPLGSKNENALTSFSPLTRLAEHTAARLHRLKGHFSRKSMLFAG